MDRGRYLQWLGIQCGLAALVIDVNFGRVGSFIDIQQGRQSNLGGLSKRKGDESTLASIIRAVLVFFLNDAYQAKGFTIGERIRLVGIEIKGNSASSNTYIVKERKEPNGVRTQAI